jgi:single-stranded DNA-binding protein
MNDSGIKQLYEVRLVGRASSDAKLETVNTAKGSRPVVKFSMWIGSGRRGKSKDYQKPFFVNIKCWGDQAKDLRKGQDVEVVGEMKRNEYLKDGELKTWDEVVVSTTEKGEPNINYEGRPMTTKHVTDEAVSQGMGKSIQQDSLEITDSDCPF